MLKEISRAFITISLFSAASAYAAHSAPVPAPSKSYLLSGLQLAVSNSDQCKASLQALQQLTQQPVILQFTNPTDHTQFNVKDVTGQLTNHSYAIMQQTVVNGVVNRVSMGTTSVSKVSVNYVVAISGDVNQPNFNYAYPAILTTNEGHCSYFAVVKPSVDTVAAFKQNIQAGAVAQSTDLSGK